CGAQRLHGAELHVHHIVFRSNSGTSDRRNLVTLCFKHHQDQHDHPISSRGGEGPGSALDASVDMIGEDEAYESLVPAMQAALHYFRATKGTRHELFCYLIGKHGSESGRLALRFAREARLLHDLSTPGEPA
ncbi:MAG: HNH endonuclease, partial [Xanthomonadales bacterium]|nr:HNH endonuclease [Xanthomonadales bacterium]